MPYDPDQHHRRSIRLPQYDYAQPGAYYVTLCTHNRLCFLCQIQDELSRLTWQGELIKLHWEKLPEHYPFLTLDSYMIMPNHLHGILILGEQHELHLTLPQIIQGFKTFSARAINKLQNTKGIPIWQRDYYEHVIQGEDDLNRIREYIINNPLKWSEDDYYVE